MIVLKIMSNEDKPDSNGSKGFHIICCDDVKFYREDGIAHANVYRGDNTDTYVLTGNAYVMQNGKTISSFAHSGYL